MANSSDITNSLGDDAALAVLDKHHVIIRQALLDHDGREVDRAGDGFLTGFASGSRAVSCAVAIQRDFDSYNRAEAEGVRILVRIGLGAGEPVTDGETLFGSTVNITARICAHAEPGQILASQVIRALCVGKNFAFRPYGAVSLKGFPDPSNSTRLSGQRSGRCSSAYTAAAQPTHALDRSCDGLGDKPAAFSLNIEIATQVM